MDIRFYTLDFSDFRILPPSSKNTGYVSMNAETEFCGNGSFKLVYYDEDTENFIKEHPEGLIVRWKNFEGYMTDYQNTESQKWAFGSHLNSLAHKYVISSQSLDGNLQEAIKKVITEETPFTFVESTADFGDTEYIKEDYQYLDTFLIDILSPINAGYRIYTDTKKVYFELLKSVSNPLILSKNNLNVYEVQEDFSNKNVAYSGWYKKTKEDDGTELEAEEWAYVSTASKTGLYRQNALLSASSPAEALKELKKCTAELDISCKTRNVEYGTDYKLGDKLRYQDKRTTVKKLVTKISQWFEKSTYHEEPTLTEWEDD